MVYLLRAKKEIRILLLGIVRIFNMKKYLFCAILYRNTGIEVKSSNYQAPEPVPYLFPRQVGLNNSFLYLTKICRNPQNCLENVFCLYNKHNLECNLDGDWLLDPTNIEK